MDWANWPIVSITCKKCGEVLLEVRPLTRNRGLRVDTLGGLRKFIRASTEDSYGYYCINCWEEEIK